MSLTDAETRALAQLVGVWAGRPFSLVGARALSLRGIDMTWRQTDDLDLVVVAETEDYPFGLDQLGQWSHDPRLEHRWLSPDGVRCDVLPAGEKLVERGTLTWPSGMQMTVSIRVSGSHSGPRRR